MLAVKDNFGSIYQRTEGCFHLQLGPVNIRLTKEAYFDLVDMVNTSQRIARPAELDAALLEPLPTLDCFDRLSRITCLAARPLLRFSLWLVVLAIRQKGDGARQAGVRMLSAIGIRAVSACATLTGIFLYLLRKISS